MALNPYTKCSATSTAVATIHKETNIGDVLGNNRIVSAHMNAASNYATLRIFGSLLLNIWRAQREDVRISAKRLAKYKNNLQKAKETIRFLNNVIVIEKNHNEKLFTEVRTFSKELILAYNTNTQLQETIDELEHKDYLMGETLCELNADNVRLLAKLNKQEEQLQQMQEQLKQYEHNYNMSQQRVGMLTTENSLLSHNVHELEALLRQHALLNDTASVLQLKFSDSNEQLNGSNTQHNSYLCTALDEQRLSFIFPPQAGKDLNGWLGMQWPRQLMRHLIVWLRQFKMCFFNEVLASPYALKSLV